MKKEFFDVNDLIRHSDLSKVREGPKK